MPPVYVSQPGAQVRTRGGRLVVVVGESALLDVPLAHVEQLTVVGRGVQVSTATMIELMGRGVEVAYLSRSGRFVGKLVGAPNGSVTIRLAQYEWVADGERALSLARLIVTAKLTNQQWLLRHLELGKAAADLGQQTGGVRSARTLDHLRGVEGAAAATYFRALRSLFATELRFRGREHHPPPDPVNATLSFGYTLLLNELIGQVNVVGLDPYAGFLHALKPGRPSLALDLEEEWRPAVDELVVRLFRHGELSDADFSVDGRGARLGPDGRKRFLVAYETQVARRLSHPLAHGQVSVRRALELQIRQVAGVLTGERQGFEAARLAEWWS